MRRSLLTAFRAARLLAGDQPRVPAGSSDGGEFASSGSAGDSAARQFIPHSIATRYPGEFTTVMADTGKLDREWARSPQTYLTPHTVGENDIENRRDQFREFLKTGKPIEQPHVVADSAGRLSFDDGRHRTRVLIDAGAKQIPLTVPHEDAEKIRQLVGSDDKSALKNSRIQAGWITIGSHEDDDGKRTGGAHVFVDGSGDITKGPPSIKGDSVASLKDKSRNDVRNVKREHAKAEDKTGRDVTRSQAQALGNQGRINQHQAAREAARGTGIPTHQVLRTMHEAHQFLTEQTRRREEAKSTARKTTGLNAGIIAKLENTYHDHTNVSRFDETSREFAAEHPEIGIDPDSHYAPHQVWEFIREGSQAAPALHSKEVADLAAEWLRSSPPPRAARQMNKPSKRSAQRVDETVPFRRSKDRLRCTGRMVFNGNVAVDAPAKTNARGRARRRAGMFRTFQGVAYNGGEMFPTLTIGGQQASKKRVVLDLDSLTIPDQIRPVLDDHDETTEGVIGQTTAITVASDYTLPVRGVLYTQKTRSQKILSANDGGHVWQLSVGVDFELEEIPAGRQVRVNGRDFTGPVTIARNGYLTDLSFVAVGGDDTTWATIAARRQLVSRLVAGIVRVRLRAASMEGFRMKTFEKWLDENFEIKDKSTLSASQLAKYQAIYDAEMAANDDGDDNDDQDNEDDTDAEDENDELDDAEGRTRQPASAAARRNGERGRSRPRARGKAGRSRRYAGSDGASADGDIERRVRNTMRMESRRESERCLRINSMAGDNTELAAKAIREGWSTDKFELAAMRASRATQSGASTKPEDDEPLLMEAALLVNSGMDLNHVGKFFDEKIMDRITAARWRGLTLVEAADRIRLRAGVACDSARNQTAHMIACRNANSRLEASGFTSMTLSSILENAADKILLDAYQSIETAWQNFCAIRSLNDFKVHSQYALDPMSVFQKVGAQGDFAQLKFGDRKYSLQADSYGVRFKIDFQTWRNDDLGSISNRIASLGELAASTVEQVFWVLFMNGLNNTSMFHANNKNYDATASSVFGVLGLTFAETMWGNQVRPNGTPLGITPQVLGVGTALKTLAGQVFTSTKLNEVFDSTNNTRKGPVGSDNPHVGKYKPTPAPYLNNTLLLDSTGAKPAAIPHQDDGLWTLAARQGNNAPFHVGFLDGQQAPTVQTINNQAEMIGFELAAGFHFGVGYGDPRLAMAFNPNAA